MAHPELFPEKRYVIDTSSLVDIQNEENPDRLWEGIYDLIRKGRLKTPAIAFPEIERMAEDGKIPQSALQKLKELKDKFVIPDEELLPEAGHIVHRHKHIEAWRDPGNPADPWVIAAGKLRGETVVTEERDTGPKKNRRIPWVCDQESVPWIRLRRLVLDEGLRE